MCEKEVYLKPVEEVKSRSFDEILLEDYNIKTGVYLDYLGNYVVIGYELEPTVDNEEDLLIAVYGSDFNHEGELCRTVNLTSSMLEDALNLSLLHGLIASSEYLGEL